MSIYDEMIQEMRDREILSGFVLLNEAPSMLAQQGIANNGGGMQANATQPAANQPAAKSQIKTQPQQANLRIEFNEIGNYRGSKVYNISYNGFLAGYVMFYNGAYTYVFDPYTEYENFQLPKRLYQPNAQQFKTLKSKQYSDVNQLKRDITTIGQSALTKTTAQSTKIQ